MKYFPHDTDSFEDEKITALFLEFGYEGLGLFYTILEKIARQEKPINGEVLKHQLRIGKGYGQSGKKLEKCWVFIEYLQLILSKNGEYYNDRLIKEIKISNYSKEKTKERVSQWREKQVHKENVTHNVTGNETVTERVRNAIDKINIIKEEEEERNDDGRISEIFRQFRNVVGKNYSDEFLIFQANNFLNKYPQIIANQAGALVNGWAARLTFQDFLQWQKSNEEPVVDKSKYYTVTNPESNEW